MIRFAPSPRSGNLISNMPGMVSPPVGLNLFVVNSLNPSVKTAELLVSVMPFAIALCVLALMVLFFPGLATWLPQFVK